jgi:hypothetical protein
MPTSTRKSSKENPAVETAGATKLTAYEKTRKTLFNGPPYPSFQKFIL